MNTERAQKDTGSEQQYDENYTMVFWDTLPVISAGEPEQEPSEAPPTEDESQDWREAAAEEPQNS